MDNTLLLTIFILFLIALLFIMARISSTRVPQKKKEKIYSRLEDIRMQVQSDDVYARRDAIIKLDNLLSKSLQIRYRNEKSCGDNLKIAKNLFRKDSYQNIWEAHKLRNSIVHKDEDIGYDEAQQVYKIYKMAINKLLQ